MGRSGTSWTATRKTSYLISAEPDSLLMIPVRHLPYWTVSKRPISCRPAKALPHTYWNGPKRNMHLKTTSSLHLQQDGANSNWLGWSSRHIGGQPALIDSMSAVFSVAALIMQVARYAEQWLLWIIVNIVSVLMWVLLLGKDPSAVMMIVTEDPYALFLQTNHKGAAAKTSAPLWHCIQLYTHSITIW